MSLSLVTNFLCTDRREGFNQLDLSTFTKLRAFSWIGLHSEEDFEALKGCLRDNATHLQALTLDLIDCQQNDFWSLDSGETNDEIPDLNNFFATDVMCLGQDSPGLHFPTLELLSLSEVSFKTAERSLASAFNFSRLQKLRLWNCPGMIELLDDVANSYHALPLVSLELVIDIHHAETLPEMEVSRFLQTISGLRDLYLSLYVWDWEPVLEAVMNHLSSLKRLVLHGRGVDADEDSLWFEEDADYSIEWNGPLSLLFELAECDVMGIANPPNFMVSLLLPPPLIPPDRPLARVPKWHRFPHELQDAPPSSIMG